jgi:heme/copper-type cytochrome/quinol oxidase subunit 2
MSSDLSQIRWAENNLKLILFLVGVIGQLATGIISLFRYYEDQPFYVFLCTIITCIFVLVFGITMLLKREDAKQEGNGSERVGLTVKGKRLFYSFGTRIAIIIMIAISTGASFTIIYEIISSKNPPNSMDFDNGTYPKYKSRSITPFITVDNIFWLGKIDHAIVNGKEQIPYAKIIDPTKDRIDKFYGDACAVSLQIRAINIADKDRATIDFIVIKVNSYLTLPEYELRRHKPAGEMPFYYVELNDPKISKTSLFKAQYYISNKERKDFSSYLIEMDNPEEIGIRINAKTPGIYKFQCEILSSHKGNKQKITLPEEYQFLFDNK